MGGGRLEIEKEVLEMLEQKARAQPINPFLDTLRRFVQGFLAVGIFGVDDINAIAFELYKKHGGDNMWVERVLTDIFPGDVWASRRDRAQMFARAKYQALQRRTEENERNR